MTPIPVSVAYAQQRDEMLADAIADWADSHGAERGINRRYALRLIIAERARRNWRRNELHTAAHANMQTRWRAA
jgi:hypothetical protein